MDYNQFKTLALTRQSCRSFNDRPLSPEVVNEIAKAALLAPSACNSQPWRLYLVTGEQKCAQVREALQDSGKNPFLSGAKAFIAVAETSTLDLRADVVTRFSKDRFIKYDVGEVVAYATLAAQSAGVSSCIIGWMNEQALANALGLEENEKCELVIALGYSDVPVRQKSRKPEDKTLRQLDV